MPPNTLKKAVARLALSSRHLHGGSSHLYGYLDASTVNQAELQMLSTTGETIRFPSGSIQALFFVQEFPDSADMSQSPSRTAARLPGVLIRVRSPERDILEGILASDLLLAKEGVWLTPAWTPCNWQRVWIPAASLGQLTILDVVRPPRRRSQRPRKPREAPAQFELFASESAGGEEQRDAVG